LIEKVLDSKYIIENKELYEMFLEDMHLQAETIPRRYIAFQNLIYNP